MRIILTNNVPKLGEVGDVCEVTPGYGRNFLLPQGLAVLATPGALRQIEDLKRTERRHQDRVRGTMRAVADRVEALRLEFTARVGQTGRLYGSITSSDIADRINEALGETIDRRKIVLDEPIRSLGEHDVIVHLMPGVDATARVVVVADAELLEDLGIDLAEVDDGDDDGSVGAPVADAEPDTAEGPASNDDEDEDDNEDEDEDDDEGEDEDDDEDEDEDDDEDEDEDEDEGETPVNEVDRG